MARKISQIDKDITAVHKQLRRLEKIDTMSAASWQDAWDKHPDLHAKEKALYRERGEAQVIRDEKAHKVAMATARRDGAKFRKESAAKFKAQQALEKAAPDLLAAVKMFIAWEEDTHKTAPANQHRLAMDAAYAAIAKVEGR